ncbi:peptidoglycan-binding protein [Ktedonospora formicarum]|uniref:HTH cro/C1-type domain-containing protein n=1 Tax=Ktedonospora formicarum TaxID=2778364 RepID=A0A8J3MV26_9CHLR|nr:peptidoglycan-binding protein [Ktedonospora formicarum]GHO47486.1 hypothetical protein KSX_56490 [Ktedonospora formicarum]
MSESRQDGYLPERELHDIQQKKSTKPTAQPNSLLRQARRKHAWSQGDLAERIGVAKETISRWENGVSRPQPQQLNRLCGTFQMTPEALGFVLDPLEEEIASRSEDPSHIQSAHISDEGVISSSPKRYFLSRRRALVAGGIALGGITLAGGTLAWFSFQGQQTPSPRHWPTAAYDLHHQTALARVVQWMLQARQYDIGSTGVDGIFGPVTQFAVKAFQKDHHLPEDGIVNSSTWELLIMPTDTGSRGSQVSALQERLRELHLVSQLTVDGEFGPQTVKALRLFRQQHHLQVKDVADLDTWCLLLGGSLSK